VREVLSGKPVVGRHPPRLAGIEIVDQQLGERWVVVQVQQVRHLLRREKPDSAWRVDEGQREREREREREKERERVCVYVCE
jgi:hypothetical protein